MLELSDTKVFETVQINVQVVEAAIETPGIIATNSTSIQSSG